MLRTSVNRCILTDGIVISNLHIANGMFVEYQILRIVSNDGTPFPAGKCFTGLEAEASEITNCPQRLPPMFGKMGLACILDNEQIVLFCNGHDVIHIDWLAHHMNRHDGPGIFGDPSLHIRRIQLERFRVKIRQYRKRTSRQDRGDCTRIRIGRSYNLVSGTNAQGLHGCMQGLGSGTNTNAVLCFHQFSKSLLKGWNGTRF